MPTPLPPDDAQNMLIVAFTAIRRGLGDYGADCYFEDLRKTAARHEATGDDKLPMPNLRDYIDDDGIGDVAGDAVELIGITLRGHDPDARIARLLKYDSPAALIAELASIGAALASRFGDDDWYTAERAASRAARLP